MTVANDSMALTASQLGKRYGPRGWALRNVDLGVPIGSVTALVGPNGAGKSTLIKAWVGFERPTEGSVAILGIDPWVDRRAGVIQTGYVPQVPSLYRDLSAEDHLALAQTLRKRFDRSLARRRLGQLGIPMEAKPSELSGGQQAQLGLAIVLGTRAPVLLLDEPLASLDPLARRDFFAVLLEEVRAEGSTVVMSSHIITDVEAACDRVVVLSGGQKLLDDAIASALREHRVAARIDAPSSGVVATFEDAKGEELVLLKGPPQGASLHRPATLEEVVIGFLASGRAEMIQ